MMRVGFALESASQGGGDTPGIPPYAGEAGAGRKGIPRRNQGQRVPKGATHGDGDTLPTGGEDKQGVFEVAICASLVLGPPPMGAVPLYLDKREARLGVRKPGSKSCH
jgi:hypothetical protein